MKLEYEEKSEKVDRLNRELMDLTLTGTKGSDHEVRSPKFRGQTKVRRPIMIKFVYIQNGCSVLNHILCVSGISVNMIIMTINLGYCLS